jgi:hypothetical protein
VQRREEDRLIVGDDVLRAVAVVHVPVDDRDAAKAELGLRPARGDCDVVEEAEAHRAVALGVVTGRPRDREAAVAHRIDRRARGKQCRFVGGLGANGVPVDPAARRAHLLDEALRVAAQDVGLGRGGALDEREPFVQHCHALLGFRVLAGRMELRERAVAYELDAAEAPLTASRISETGRSVRMRPMR